MLFFIFLKYFLRNRLTYFPNFNRYRSIKHKISLFTSEIHMAAIFILLLTIVQEIIHGSLARFHVNSSFSVYEWI
jgi:hypothetical protein